jgi:hypothetical protein
MVVAMLVHAYFPSSRGLVNSSTMNQKDLGDVYQEFDNDDDITSRPQAAQRVQKRKAFKAMSALTSFASDFDLVSDWFFYYDSRARDGEYRQAYQADGSPDGELPYLIPPLLLNTVLGVCLVGTFMWMVLATDGRLLSPFIRL